jgi:hypothetical protein
VLGLSLDSDQSWYDRTDCAPTSAITVLLVRYKSDYAVSQTFAAGGSIDPFGGAREPMLDGALIGTFTFR